MLEPDADDPTTPSDEFPARPDLVLIDGGPVSSASRSEVLDELGIHGHRRWSASPRGRTATPAASISISPAATGR